VKHLGHFCLLLWMLLPVRAQEASGSGNPDDVSNKYWLSGQLNVVTQFHAAFPAAYSGPSSLQSDADIAATWVATAYTGYALSPRTEFFFDLEAAHGAGVSGALGLGGLGNLDAVTDTTATAAPYIARAMVRKIIPLGKQMVPETRNPLGLAANVPARRLELRLGKMSLTDFFDLNAVGSDSHL
jgi:high affinity Mn2+ porin